MAVSDWNTNAVLNTSIGGYSLSGPYGHIFAEMMAQIAAKFGTVDTAVDAAGDGVEAVQAEIGAWTDTSETTTVKAAIEALRPEPETEG